MKRPEISPTALGTKAYDTAYRLGEMLSQAKLAPIALLVELLGNKREFDEIALLYSVEAIESTFPILEEGLYPGSCKPTKASMEEKLGRKVNLIEAVDERCIEEQKAEPYFLGNYCKYRVG